jgi:hypothetical protein
MVASLVLFIPFILASIALAPAFYLGRAKSPSTERRIAALAIAVLLNGIAFLLTSKMSYLVIFAIPFFCFCIAATVAGVIGVRAWLFGFLASPWFVAPYLVDWLQNATPDQITAYGRFPWQMIYLTLPFSAAGSLAAEVALTLGEVVGQKKTGAAPQ